jgi:predicted Zn peptidase
LWQNEGLVLKVVVFVNTMMWKWGIGGVMNYSDIYDSNFLDKFGAYKSEVSSISLDKKYEIDVLAIAETCDIPVEYTSSEHSGWSINQDSFERKIVINKFEPEYRQRFTIAHEIGHIILNHQGKSYRTNKLEEYSDTIARMNEIAANNFAAQLIMPEKLVKESLRDSINELGYSLDQDFSEREIAKIISFSASQLNVSAQALSYRVDNLGLFIDE